VFLAAQSGAGKTATLVGIAEPLISKGRNVLIISNEERASDIVMRIAAIQNGWNINEKYEWDYDSDIWAQMEEKCVELAENPHLTIIDNYIAGKDFATGREISPLDTTNIQQFTSALEAVERDGKKYDILIIDYISKIINSDENTQAWQVLKKAITTIEEFSKKNKIPSVVFTQLKDKQVDKEGKAIKESFKNRLPGSTQMYDAVTNAIEIDTDFEAGESTWIWHKIRYGHRQRHTLKFYKGKYFDMQEKEVDTEE
jgi:predicted ATP-dependent serine protease